REIVAGLRSPNRCIIIASHNLDELQRVADRVAIMDHGKLQRLVSTGYESLVVTETDFRLAVFSGAERVRELVPGAVDLGKGEFELRVADVGQLNTIIARLIAAGILIGGVVPMRSVLEQQFRDAVGERP